MKRATITMLIVAFVLIEFDTGSSLPSVKGNTSGQEVDSNDLILVMLQQIKDDVSELTTKTDSLQATTDNLQVTVGGLSLKVRNLEDQVQNLEDKVEGTSETSQETSPPEITIESINRNVSMSPTGNGASVDVAPVVGNYGIVNYGYITIQQLVTGTDDVGSLFNGNVTHYVGCEASNNGYAYEWVFNAQSWYSARSNCMYKGGDLAYHGFDNMDFREELICNQFKRCSDGRDDRPWIGLTRMYSNDWEYLDGTPSPYSSLWYSSDDYADPSQDCAGLAGSEYGNAHFLQNYSYWCDPYMRPSICEYSCTDH